MPKAFYTPTVAAVGLAFCDACHLGPKTNGRFFFAEYKTGNIVRVRLNSTRKAIASQSVVANNSGVTSIETAPDGSLYISNDHAIYKLV
jgi:glucose/arabinose dehydrogenase